MKKLLPVLLVILLCSCTMESSLNDPFPQYYILEQFESFFSQVTFKTGEMIYPKVYSQDGQDFVVAVINGFENPEDATTLEGTLSIQEGIMAINSNAFALADNVTEVVLPTSCQSLGTNSLPQKASKIVISDAAAKDLDKAIADENKGNVTTIVINGSGGTQISGSFDNLEQVQVVNESPNKQGFWPSLPTLSDKDGLYFIGWYDQEGNKIQNGTRIENHDVTLIMIDSKEYYLLATAFPKYSETPPEEPFEQEDKDESFTNYGFNIPYYLIGTDAEYVFAEFRDCGNGIYNIKPGTAKDVRYELFLNGEAVAKDNLNVSFSDGIWVLNLNKIGKYSFSCFYKDLEGNAVGYGQVTFNYKPQ